MRVLVCWSSLLWSFATLAQQAPPAPPAQDDVERVTTAYVTRGAKDALGSTYRADYAAALDSVQHGDLATGRAGLERIAAACDGYARPGLELVAVHTADEYERFVRESGDGSPTEWLDMVCPSTLKGLAFVHVEAGDSPDVALDYLDKAIRLAPYWADPYTERGFILAHSGRLEEALTAYREAIRRAEATRENGVLALAWRGVGYAQGELHAWTESRAAYRRSLEIEPGNAIAENELQWIDQQDPAGAQPSGHAQ
jgi:tetratricopeptide (TPR) repeat protein